MTFADFLDTTSQTDWAAFVLEEISKWCSAYYDQGQSSWRMPWRKLDLFAAWKAAAKLDTNPELMGLELVRAFVAGLPDDPNEIVGRALGNFGVSGLLQVDFLAPALYEPYRLELLRPIPHPSKLHDRQER